MLLVGSKSSSPQAEVGWERVSGQMKSMLLRCLILHADEVRQPPKSKANMKAEELVKKIIHIVVLIHLSGRNSSEMLSREHGFL